MKEKTDRKVFWTLLVASVIATFLVLPYTLALSTGLAKLMTPLVMVAQVIQAAIIFSISIFVGLKLSKKVGFKEIKFKINKDDLKLSVGLGILSGMLIIILSFLFSSLSLTFMKAEMGVATWKGLLAAFYGGIAEEIVFRLFLMTLLVWIVSKFTKGKTTNAGVWIALILSTIVFGLGHLGITSSLVAITPLVVLRAVLLNGVSVFFGWLYWKKGLESAMVAHFSADIVIHVIIPLIIKTIV